MAAACWFFSRWFCGTLVRRTTSAAALAAATAASAAAAVAMATANACFLCSSAALLSDFSGASSIEGKCLNLNLLNIHLHFLDFYENC